MLQLNTLAYYDKAFSISQNILYNCVQAVWSSDHFDRFTSKAGTFNGWLDDKAEYNINNFFFV